MENAALLRVFHKEGFKKSCLRSFGDSDREREEREGDRGRERERGSLTGSPRHSQWEKAAISTYTQRHGAR